MRAFRSRAGLLLLGGLVLASGVRALDEVTLDLERVEGAGWAAEGLKASLALHSDRPFARASIARLKLAAVGREITDVRAEIVGRARRAR